MLSLATINAESSPTFLATNAVTLASYQKKKNQPKPKIHLCPCGKIAVKKTFGCIWSCQDCLDKDVVVQSLHKQDMPMRCNLNGEEWKAAQERRNWLAVVRYHKRKHDQPNPTQSETT